MVGVDNYSVKCFIWLISGNYEGHRSFNSYLIYITYVQCSTYCYSDKGNNNRKQCIDYLLGSSIINPLLWKCCVDFHLLYFIFTLTALFQSESQCVCLYSNIVHCSPRTIMCRYAFGTHMFWPYVNRMTNERLPEYAYIVGPVIALPWEETTSFLWHYPK